MENRGHWYFRYRPENIFSLFDDTVIIRSSCEGVPLMTTSGIYGPIPPHTKVQLTPGLGNGVMVVPADSSEMTLIEKLKQLQDNSTVPDETNATIIAANWVSSRDGGNFSEVW
jgi:hypothetical protein